jgi:hypothetical protein
MTSIASLAEFAYALRRPGDTAFASRHQVLLELAEGLVVDELGQLDTYPTRAKTVVLDAAARAYFNLAGHQQEELGDSVRQPLDAAKLGVYLDDDDLCKLHGRDARTPSYSFPEAAPYPDPVECPPRTVSG